MEIRVYNLFCAFAAICFSHFAFADVVMNPGVNQVGTIKYYAIFFGYQDRTVNIPGRSHTFATFVKVLETPAGQKILDNVDISFLPGDFDEQNSLHGSRKVPGRNFSVAETLAMAERHELHVRPYGPYEIGAPVFDRAILQSMYLNSGMIDYQMVDKFHRELASKHQPGGALNCIHAVSDIVGYLPTGFKRGYSATLAVVNFFAENQAIRQTKDHAIYRAYMQQVVNADPVYAALRVHAPKPRRTEDTH